jgi:hypothetical protein
MYLATSTVQPARGFGNVFVIGSDHLAQTSGSSGAERGVEPTRSQNITVNCRRSALSCLAGWPGRGGHCTISCVAVGFALVVLCLG